MKNASGEFASNRGKRWPAPNLKHSGDRPYQSISQPESAPGLFEYAPYPLAIILGTATMLLLIATLKSLWLWP
ncbi:hypothetical protein [Mariniblastus fucicola]|nr:hypothetical protein [Mariniblastus fucicola]